VLAEKLHRIELGGTGAVGERVNGAKGI